MLEQGDILLSALVEEGLVDRPAAEAALREAAGSRRELGEVLVARGLLREREVALVQATICECPFVDPDGYVVDIRNSALVPRALAESVGAFPLFVMDGVVTVGMLNPLDLKGVDQLRAVLRAELDPVLCPPSGLRRLIDRAYALTAEGDGGPDAGPAAAATLTTGKEPVVAAVNQILSQAMERGASDVHLGPDEDRLHLRYRVDGSLVSQQGPGLSMHAGIVQRIKVMANLDLTQTRRPQDGKFRFEQGGRRIDVRVSIIPTVCGENVVLRLLTGAASVRALGELGMGPEDVALLEPMLDAPNGMVLVTGPTGSGKTTTLYAALKRLNTPDRNVVTIEDPVEIRVPLVRQVQVNAEIGMTFAGALRSILRQDPDVVLVGEIRDEETARIALQAALTGHLVLSSLHTNDAPGALTRLRDLGCPPFAINAALLCCVAQRLAKRVCAECAAPAQPPAAVLARFGLGTDGGERFTAGRGCPRCGNAGYRGRVGLYEVMRAGPTLGGLVEAGESAAKMREVAIASGMRPMWRDGLEKARLGLTTLAEVLRVAAVADVESTGAPRTPPPAMRLSA